MSKVVHFEIPVDDRERALTFYRTALDWEITGFGDQPYWLVQAGADEEPGANGALLMRGDVHEHPVLVVGVADLDEALGRVQGAGGQVLHPKMPIPGVGWSAYIRDSEGNTIGLFQPEAGAGAG